MKLRPKCNKIITIHSFVTSSEFWELGGCFISCVWRAYLLSKVEFNTQYLSHSTVTYRVKMEYGLNVAFMICRNTLFFFKIPPYTAILYRGCAGISLFWKQVPVMRAGFPWECRHRNRVCTVRQPFSDSLIHFVKGKIFA